MRQAVFGAWGEVDTDPHVRAGAFHFTAEWRGDALVAVQPERSEPKLKKDSYHDLARTPPHHYVAFYLWLSRHSGCDCIVHIGAHGTLEWLPGKAVALSRQRNRLAWQPFQRAMCTNMYYAVTA